MISSSQRGELFGDALILGLHDAVIRATWAIKDGLNCRLSWQLVGCPNPAMDAAFETFHNIRQLHFVEASYTWHAPSLSFYEQAQQRLSRKLSWHGDRFRLDESSLNCVRRLPGGILNRR
jgi:hypothetical protein